MIRGVFTAASGMITEQKKLDVLGNNISNVNTAGYKSDTLSLKSFDQVMIDRMSEGTSVGTLTYGAQSSQLSTDLSQGNYETTGLNTDLAISGDGFFAVEANAGAGGAKFTRDGSFVVDNQGFLALNSGERLLDVNGRPIQVGGDKFTVDTAGNVTVGGDPAPRTQVLVYTGPNNTGIVKRNDGFFDIAAPQVAGGFIKQGSIEGSNVDMVSMMTQMMSATRAFQMNSQAFKATNETMDKLVNSVGAK